MMNLLAAAQMHSPSSHEGNPQNDADEMASLLEMTTVLSGSPALQDGIREALGILERRHGVQRGMVTVLREGTRELHIAASFGLSADDQRARYHVGEGVTGRVVATGKPVVVPQISQEPLFLNRAGRRRPKARETTVVCVPVPGNRGPGGTLPAGTLNVDLPYDRDRNYARAIKFFSLAAAMIGQAMKIGHLLDSQRELLREENAHLREELLERYDFSNLVGNSSAMRRVYEQVTQVAPSNTTVMLRGESGTGKELIAHAVHYNSPRKNHPFIKVNCAALPETLIESELFGYEKGAFTGADTPKEGRFGLAEGGTLFLDEVGELKNQTALKLLRVLQEREYERLGGTKTIKTDVRLIVATNKDLERAIAAGTFREDLYYRLNVFTIFVPPLRERKSDVLLLADHFLEKYAGRHRKNIKRISTPAIDMLTSYHWPGNVRELENTIERAVLVCEGNVIHGHHRPPTLQTAEASGTVTNVSFKTAVEAYERDLIEDILKTTRGNRAKAAALLKTTSRVLNYKIKNLNIDCKRFRV
jgi:Nif-specific regulatory protein